MLLDVKWVTPSIIGFARTEYSDSTHEFGAVYAYWMTTSIISVARTEYSGVSHEFGAVHAISATIS